MLFYLSKFRIKKKTTATQQLQDDHRLSKARIWQRLLKETLDAANPFTGRMITLIFEFLLTCLRLKKNNVLVTVYLPEKVGGFNPFEKY